MVGPIFDDYFHVLSACHVREALPNYRPLVYWLNCIGGESLMFTRSMSFLFIVLTCILLAYLFFRRWDWMAFLLACTHPITLFPVFYASQISTSMTVLWAALVVTLLVHPMKSLWLNVAAWALLIPAGVYLRVEAWIDAVLILGALWLFRTLRGESLRIRMHRMGWLVLALLPALVLVADSVGMSITSVFSLLESQSYPKDGQLALGIWAVFLYCVNYVFSFDVSFYGPWLDWWQIHTTPAYQWALYFGMTAVIGLCVYGTLAKRGTVRFLSAGGLVFVLTCLAFSVHFGADWYFPSRMYLATLLVSPFVLQAIRPSRETPKDLVGAFVTVQALCLAFTYFCHYRNADEFAAFEFKSNRGSHPLVHFVLADRALAAGDVRTALNLYYEAYQITAAEPLRVASDRAAIFNLQALFNGYAAAKALGETENARSAFNVLIQRQSAYSTLACLMEEAIPLSECTTRARWGALCSDLHKIDPSGQMNQKAFRFSPKRFCAQPYREGGYS